MCLPKRIPMVRTEIIENQIEVEPLLLKLHKLAYEC